MHFSSVGNTLTLAVTILNDTYPTLSERCRDDYVKVALIASPTNEDAGLALNRPRIRPEQHLNLSEPNNNAVLCLLGDLIVPVKTGFHSVICSWT